MLDKKIDSKISMIKVRLEARDLVRGVGSDGLTEPVSNTKEEGLLRRVLTPGGSSPPHVQPDALRQARTCSALRRWSQLRPRTEACSRSLQRQQKQAWRCSHAARRAE